MPLFIFFIGLFVGSFLNVLADRLPRGEDVLFGRSHCDFCKKTLRWYELIPVFSFMFARGRCLRCHKKLSLQYPLSELACGLGFMYLYPSGILMVIFSALLVLFIADLKYMMLPDSMIIVAALFALLYHVSLTNFIAAGACFLLFYGLYLLTRGRGMGFGDVKFAPVIGLLLGYPLTIVALYIAFLTGAITGVILMIGGRAGLKSKIAFGPFLILGTAITFVWGQNILTVLHLWNFLW